MQAPTGSGGGGSATERANARTKDMDLLTTEQMLRAINDEDRGVAGAVAEVIPAIARVVDAVAAAFAAGGRLHYFGAGTSGRLAVLDASECPPTFGVAADMVQGHIAGGRAALTDAIEGAEDDEPQGRRDVDAAAVTRSDVVVAITASGRTPWCLGVLARAAEIGAATVALTCNRDTPVHRSASMVIDPMTGEEVLSGSTRLKAGTAQKLVLNMISTAAMVRLGRTYGNLMVGVTPTNAKLRDRAIRLVAAITGRESGARDALEACGWDVRVACLAVARSLSPDAARRALAAASGSLRRALEQ